MESREERKRELTRQRVQRHRERQADEAQAKAEAKAERQSLIAQYGTDRVENWEWTAVTVQIAMAVLDYFKHWESKINDGNILEALASIESWSRFYEPDAELDDSWQRCCRMGLLPQPKDAAAYFQNLYQKYLGNPVAEPEQQILPLTAPMEPQPVPKPVEPPKPVCIITKEPPKPISMDEYLDQQHGFTSSRV